MRLSKRAVAGAVLTLTSCATFVVHRVLRGPADFTAADRTAPYVKLHTRDGRVYVLSPWQMDTTARQVRGTGQLLDANRHILGSRTDFAVPFDSVALLETNTLSSSSSPLVAMTVITGIVAGVCLSNPKACFGSCPTFYLDDGHGMKLMAEGFSASIAPALEATDVDALYLARPSTRDLDVRLTNEAYETHVIRRARIIAARRPAGGRVFATDAGTYRTASDIVPPSRCTAPEGDCLARVEAYDHKERMSRADSTNLAARETIELSFPRPKGREVGVVIASRQTLLTTYLFYSALSFLGDRAGDWLASLGKGDTATAEQARLIGTMLGGIDVEAMDASGRWIRAGRTAETGPIATDVRLVELPAAALAGDSVRVRLTLAPGAWRLDWLALAALGPAPEVVELDPVMVTRHGTPAPALRGELTGDGGTLVTLPGDTLMLRYRLPPDVEHWELFLESRGYYLEWLRREWRGGQNLRMAALMARDPATALRRLAGPFSRAEPALEADFWRSRYGSR